MWCQCVINKDKMSQDLLARIGRQAEEVNLSQYLNKNVFKIFTLIANRLKILKHTLLAKSERKRRDIKTPGFFLPKFQMSKFW